MKFADETPQDSASWRGEHANERLARAVVAELDREARELDATTLRRLRAARRTALANRATRASRRNHRFVLRVAGGTFAAVALVTALWAIRPAEPPHAPVVAATPSTVDSLPVLTASEDLEFYRSVDFLLWLENRSVEG